MGEVIATISFVSAIAGLIDISCRVIKILDNFHSRTNEVPQQLQNVYVQLPVVVNSLKRTEEKYKRGSVDEETAKALVSALTVCNRLISSLAEEPNKVLPLKNDTSLDRALKAIKSVSRDHGMQKKLKELDHYLLYFIALNTSDPTRLDIERIPASSVFMIPTRKDPRFIDRPDLFKELNANLTSYGRAALAGIGGAGKTQIAIEYCCRLRQRYTNAQVFWAHAGTVLKFNQACKTIAQKLELPGWNDPQTNNLQQVYDWLHNDKSGRWLFVLDNMDNVDILETPLQLLNRSVTMNEFFPSALGTVIVTTRDRRVGERLAVRGKTIIVSMMEMVECRQLLDSYLPSSQTHKESDQEDLINILDYLPLGITQAAAYITEKCISIGEYLSMFSNGDEDMEKLLSECISDDRRGDQDCHSIFKTWKLSFDQIVKQNPRAADTLSLMSTLDRQEIPPTIIMKTEESLADFLDAMAMLQNFSLVSKSTNGDNYGMHRLVQLSTQAWLRVQGTTIKWRREALYNLASEFPSGDFETWSTCEALLPHVWVILPIRMDGDSCLLKRAKLLSKLAYFDYKQGRNANGISKSQEGYDTFVKLESKDCLEALSCLALNALCNMNEGNLLVAESLFRNIDFSYQNIYVFDHPKRLNVMGNLAWVLYRLSRYQEAEELYRRVCFSQEQVLGLRDSDTLESMNNLGLVLLAQNNETEAEELLRRTLAIREDLFGPDHMVTIQNQGFLALGLNKLGRHKEAEHFYRLAMVSCEKFLGVDHPLTLSVTQDLAICLDDQHKSQEAEQLARRVLPLIEKAWGTDHYTTNAGKYNLAGYLAAQQQFEEAAELLHTLWAMNEHVKEHEDPNWKRLMIKAEQGLAYCKKQISSGNKNTRYNHRAFNQDIPETSSPTRNRGLSSLFARISSGPSKSPRK